MKHSLSNHPSMFRHLKDPVVSIFVLIGILMIVGGLGLAWNDHQKANWPKVVASVISSQAAQSGSQYVGQLVIRPADGGAEQAILTNWTAGNPADMQEFLSPWPVGTTAQFPRNPSDPKDVRLPSDPRQAIVPWGLVASGLVFMVIPFVMIAISDRKDAFQLAGLAMAASGFLVLVLGGVLTAKKAATLKQWPSVEATVISSQIGYRPGNRASRGVDVLMRYDVEGRSVETIVGTRGGTSNVEWLRAQVDSNFTPGSKHTVRYKPSAPTIATFEAEWSFGYFWEVLVTMLGGLLLIALGLMIRRFAGKS